MATATHKRASQHVSKKSAKASPARRRAGLKAALTRKKRGTSTTARVRSSYPRVGPGSRTE